MESSNNEVGYLLLKDDGAVLESRGDLKNDECSANILLDLLHLTESVDENFMPNSTCERISIVYEDHTYNICMSNRRIYIVKLRGCSLKNGSYATAANNGSTGVICADPGDNGDNGSASTTVMA